MLSMDDFHESYTFFNDWSLHDVSFSHKFFYGHPSKTRLIRTKETHFSFNAICQSTKIHMTSNDIHTDISSIPFITKMIFVIWIYLILDTSYILKGRSQELLQIDFYHLMLERVTLGFIVFMYAHIPIRKRIKSNSSIMGMSKWNDNVQRIFFGSVFKVRNP